MTDRLWDCTPPPQDLEHVDHADQAPTTQGRGHGWVLQLCCSDKDGHALPPLRAAMLTERVRMHAATTGHRTT